MLGPLSGRRKHKDSPRRDADTMEVLHCEEAVQSHLLHRSQRGANVQSLARGLLLLNGFGVPE